MFDPRREPIEQKAERKRVFIPANQLHDLLLTYDVLIRHGINPNSRLVTMRGGIQDGVVVEGDRLFSR